MARVHILYQSPASLKGHPPVRPPSDRAAGHYHPIAGEKVEHMSCCSHSDSTSYTCNQPCPDLSAVTTPIAVPRRSPERLVATNGCCCAKDCAPILLSEECTRDYRKCSDHNGCSALYPADCRNQFWPDFSHPTWLPCHNLYCDKTHGMGNEHSCCRRCCCRCNCGCGC